MSIDTPSDILQKHFYKKFGNGVDMVFQCAILYIQARGEPRKKGNKMIIKSFETKAQAERFAIRYSAKANEPIEVITMGGTWYAKYQD